VKYLLLTSIFLFAAVAVTAQTASNEPFQFPGERRRDDDSRILKEMLAKQKSSREKKEYEELLERGRSAVKLSEELERSLSKKSSLSESDKKRLEAFEKLVLKIRDDLGGDDDGETSITEKDSAPPKDVREGVLYLKRSTENLFGELKRSTRFSVSIAAIESSNALIRLARFLRLRN
jgi:hypothetical protein